MNSEKQLLKRARNLEPEALELVYDQYSTKLYRYAVRLLSDPDLAEECVAETFSRFLKAIHDGGGPKRYLQAYLYRIAHNWVTDLYRGKEEVPLPEDPIADEDQDAEVLETIEDGIERERLRQALMQLTPDQRQVLVLKYIDEWKNAEIARSMEKTVGSVKALQHRGLRSLHRILTSDRENE